MTADIGGENVSCRIRYFLAVHIDLPTLLDINIVGTKLQVHRTGKQKAISQHTTAHLATFKPECQLFMSCEYSREEVVFITRAWKTIS